MRRAAIIFVLIFSLGIALSSCNKNACPAYTQIDTEQIENIG